MQLSCYSICILIWFSAAKDFFTVTLGSWKINRWSLSNFSFNCSQEDWGQSWNRHKDSILDYSVVNQGCPCQAAKGNNMTLVPVNKLAQFQATADCFCAPLPQVEWSFVSVVLKMRNLPLIIWRLLGIFRLPNTVSIENSCFVATSWTCIVAFLCASALEQLISFSFLNALGILCLLV